MLGCDALQVVRLSWAFGAFSDWLLHCARVVIEGFRASRRITWFGNLFFKVSSFTHWRDAPAHEISCPYFSGRWISAVLRYVQSRDVPWEERRFEAMAVFLSVAWTSSIALSSYLAGGAHCLRNFAKCNKLAFWLTAHSIKVYSEFNPEKHLFFALNYCCSAKITASQALKSTHSRLRKVCSSGCDVQQKFLGRFTWSPDLVNTRTFFFFDVVDRCLLHKIRKWFVLELYRDTKVCTPKDAESLAFTSTPFPILICLQKGLKQIGLLLS